jgi:hypothetical protein
MTRVTTIPFSFSLAAAADNSLATQPLPLPFRITHLYALASPTPNQLMYIQLFKWAGGNAPATGNPGGVTVFDDMILGQRIRMSVLPIDWVLDIPVTDIHQILCYCYNGAAAQNQCQVGLEVALPATS